METVTMRELRNHGRQVIDRVERGESLVVTRDGAEVAELRPLRPRGLSAQELVARWAHLPAVEPEAFRSDLDAVLDGSV